ncbi:MAG: HAMP domain-containing histidine kinase [Gammaproteobacteria bacterium]|nr:MAG: HAMP domain-containing histidine kinase [Gammaproteobacteria bacterium]
MFQYLGYLAVVLFFARNKEKSRKERLNAMSSMATSVAHELLTPLATLNIGAKNIKKYFPYFSQAYLMATQANLPVETINASTFKLIEKTSSDMELETEAAALFIDMLLMNVGSQFGVNVCKTFLISNCVTETLPRYPFSKEERDLIHCSKTLDFTVKGEYLLITHVLFNLLRNSLFHIAQENKGKIFIWLETNKEHKLFFKDTGTGIAKEWIGRIFDRFYTQTPHGAGIGLTFYKAAMQFLGGEILCEYIQNEYTLFTLKFPKMIS